METGGEQIGHGITGIPVHAVVDFCPLALLPCRKDVKVEKLGLGSTYLHLTFDARYLMLRWSSRTSLACAGFTLVISSKLEAHDSMPSNKRLNHLLNTAIALPFDGTLPL